MKKLKAQVAVLDDEEPVRRALERLLRSAGLGVDVFATGEDFFARAGSLDPDCLILDLHMPGMTGFDVQARLIALHSSIPVVIITGHDTPEARARVDVAGAAAYLQKPVDEQALLDAIDLAIARGGNL